uniref:Uncharacterized protein n=1 Tax=Globisporangium ultimum (strain ATCC 200006 / CBS 805.95 / DAOM BR144) TaxID=431595 RepID=K3X5I5_GLOUD
MRLVSEFVWMLSSLIHNARVPQDTDAAEIKEFHTALIDFLKQNSEPKNIFYRVASNREVLNTLNSLHGKMLELARRVANISDDDQHDWNSKWLECSQIREAQMVFQLKETRNVQEILPDRTSQIEALTFLKYELDKYPCDQLVFDAYKKLSSQLNIHDVSVPKWLIPRYEIQFSDKTLQTDGTFGSVYVGALHKNKVIPQFGEEIVKFQEFMLEHKKKNSLERFLRRRTVEREIYKFHSKIDFLYQLLNLTHIAESAAWQAKYYENERVHRERLDLIVSQNQVIISEIRGRALIE